MKKILILIFFFLPLSIDSLAQTLETFDIATFRSPIGWKRQNKDGVAIFNTTDQKKGTYAMITLYASGNSSWNAKSDFDSEWQEFIAGQLGVKGNPEIVPAKKAEGWELIGGAAAFENQMGTSAVMLNTFSGHGKKFSVAAIFNSQDNLPAIEAFISSIKLKNPEAVPQQSPANDNSSASILGTWGVSRSDQSSFTARNAVRGYTKKEYMLNADGTYRFISKTFEPTSTKLFFGKETGTYRVDGDLLTITPKSSVLEGWSKKNGSGDHWGTRLDSQTQTLETVTYRFTKHYFSGIQTWSLVLQAGKATQRDGPFSGSTAFSNAWIYSPPCERCFIELPR